MINKVYNMDCNLFMKDCKDKEFDLAIVDPPYGIGINGKVGGDKLAKVSEYKNKGWDIKPSDKEYFIELKKISKNQIIWGANHFISKIPYDSSCWIVWDKMNGKSDFADCELAWTSFSSATRIYKYMWNGMLQQNMKNKEDRIHETQKPIALYKWLLQNYAKPGQTIFDSHVGSGSIRIACYDMGFDFIGTELDKDYFEAQEKRFQAHISQQELFEKSELQKIIFDKEKE